MSENALKRKQLRKCVLKGTGKSLGGGEGIQAEEQCTANVKRNENVLVELHAVVWL